MIPNIQRRQIKRIAVFALACALLLLLLSQSTGPHAAPLIWLALVPVFLFGIIELRSLQWLPTEENSSSRRRNHARSALFQRPPPLA